MEGPIKPFTITHVVLGVYNRNGRQDESRILDWHNVPWLISLEKDQENCCVFLVCERTATNDWTIDLEWKISVISIDGKTHTVSGNSHYNRDSTVNGAQNLLSWSDLMSQYVIDKKVILEAEVKILAMEGIDKPPKLQIFDDAFAEKHSNATVLVKDEKFFVNKQFLSRESPFFEFEFNRFHWLSEIQLDDIEPGHFQSFLEVLYHEPALTDDNLENVLRLSQKYETINVTRECEKFLKFRSRISLKIKLEYAVRYYLNSVKTHIFENLMSPAEVRAATDPKLDNPEILKGLLEISLKLNNPNY